MLACLIIFGKVSMLLVGIVLTTVLTIKNDGLVLVLMIATFLMNLIKRFFKGKGSTGSNLGATTGKLLHKNTIYSKSSGKLNYGFAGESVAIL